MNTDRELLVLAAFAAGLTDLLGWHVYGGDAPYWLNDPKQSEPRYWNPLTDGNDALELSTKLKTRVEFHDGGVSAYIEGAVQGYFEDIHDNDFASATRRAIVRAAAEIGATL